MLPAFLSAGIVLASTAPAPPLMRAFPSYVLVRGGAITEPILIYHRPSPPFRGIKGVITYSPVATLFSLEDPVWPQPALPGQIVYEVAEFWMASIASGGRPPSPPKWESASQYSRLHVTTNGEVYWEALKGEFQGARVAYQRLPLPGIEVLAEFGVPLPASVPRFDPLAAATKVVGCWQLQSNWHFGPGEVGAGLPARIVLDAAPADANGRWPLSVPSTAASRDAWARGTWSFSRADMIIAEIPGPQGIRRAHLSFEDVPGALRGMVDTGPLAPADLSGDGAKFLRTNCP